MPEDMNPNTQPNAGIPDTNSVDGKVARLEEAVAKILEMLQGNNIDMSKEDKEKEEETKEVEKEDKGKKETPLPKAPAEDGTQDDDNPESDAESSKDEKELVEKELKEIKKSLNELKGLKKILEINKSTTPRPNYDGKELQKSFNRPKSFQDARMIVKQRGMNR